MSEVSLHPLNRLTTLTNRDDQALVVVGSGQGSTADATETKTALGLGNVDNTSDADKPVSTAQQTALDGKVDDSQLSTTGGANKVPQLDGSGDFITGDYNNDEILGPGGRILIPRRRMLGFMDGAGAIFGGFYGWPGHSGGDEIVASSPRWAWYWTDGWQMGSPATARDNRYIYIQPNAATVSDTLVESPPLSFVTRYWDGAASVSENIWMYARPTDTTANSQELVFNVGGAVPVSDHRIDDGTEIVTISDGGLYTPGLAPAFDTLTDGATITVTCSRFKTVQSGSVTLTDNRTLAFTGLVAGMRGVIYVTQDGTGNRTLTPSNGSALNLSTTADYTDRVCWDFDGMFVNFTVEQNIQREVVVSDADALAFLTAASITDNTQKAAVSVLVDSLKTASLWTKMHALYPFVGASSAAHAVNLKNPGTYDITDDAAWQAATHDANGVTGNGTSAFGKTGLAVSAVGSQDSFGLSFYSRTTLPTLSGYVAGAVDGSGYRTAISRYKPGGTDYVSVSGINNNTNNQIIRGSGDDWRQFLSGNREGASSQFIMVGAGVSTNAAASTGMPTTGIYLLALNSNGSTTGYSNINLAFAAFHEGLSQSETATLRGIIDTFQSTLGRANP